VRTDDRLQLVRGVYEAFASGDRDFVERSFTDDFRFSSPLDVDLNRAGYFERCWPGAGRGQEFEFVRLVESGDEVIVTYEMKKPDGNRGRNTEILTFKGDRVCRTEVYFGWNVR
jgi:ketosteroid isomerase-like protein